MDYKNLNKIEVDGNGNIVLQDINNSTITIQSTDTKELVELIKSITEQQAFEIKELLGKQHENIVKDIRILQEEKDEQKIKEKAKIVNPDIDRFKREILQMDIDLVKDMLMTNYKLLRKYEELLVLESDPTREMNYQYHIKDIKIKIENGKNELKELVN